MEKKIEMPADFLKWLNTYVELQRPDGMQEWDFALEVGKEVYRHLSLSKPETGLRWVRASERRPEQCKLVIVRPIGKKDIAIVGADSGDASEWATDSSETWWFDDTEWLEELESIPSSEPAAINDELLEARKIIKNVKETGRADGSYKVYKEALAFLDKYPESSPTEPAKESRPPMQRAEFEKLVWKLWKEDGSPQVNMHAYLQGAIVMDRYYRQQAAPHPEPSEQSQGAFLEWLDQEESKTNDRINLALGKPKSYSALSFYFEKLQTIRAKYLSLHAQPSVKPTVSMDEYLHVVDLYTKKCLETNLQPENEPSVKSERGEKSECTCIYGPTDANPHCTYPNCFKPEEEPQPSPAVEEDEICPKCGERASTHSTLCRKQPSSVVEGETISVIELILEVKKLRQKIEDCNDAYALLEQQMESKQEEARGYRKALEEWKAEASGSGCSWGWIEIRSRINNILSKFPSQQNPQDNDPQSQR